MLRRERNQRLRVLRAERDWTQLYLGHKANVAPSRISLIENGYSDPTEKERARIAKAFDLPESDVFPNLESVNA